MTLSTKTAAQGSSHLFQNAAGFDIVGGQFVLGDVHNHPGTGPGRSSTSRPALSTLDEAFSESEIYCSLLLRQKRGFPLYVPGPQINLPAPYQRHGVAIGDVGSVTPEGIFDFFFNVFLPPEHPINANHTPVDFSPMPSYEAIDVFHLNYDPGNYVATSTVQKRDWDPPDEFPGDDFVFSCDGPQGAILALPYGAHLEKLRNVESLRTYAATHADSWYEYINGARGRGLANGDLYLVTGCEKARSWGIASYHTIGEEEFILSFKPTSRADTTYRPYRWGGADGQRNPSKRKGYDPPSLDDPVNQTTFVHGLSISLGTGLWARLFGTVTVETSSLADFHFRVNRTGDSQSTGSGGSLLSWSWNLLGGGTTGGNRHAGEPGAVVLSDLSPIARSSILQN
ncbi:hypothetical protein B0H13DRAFT_1133097 [Mycena leptocephala]|nr:hypothetical protein B0H13DRAFT_1133097 [Mycena leptocephala]